MKRIPKYAKHKSGQARVRLNGKDVYLGKYDSAESRERYNELVAELLATRHENQRVTVDQLAIRMMTWARGYYIQRESDGRIATVRSALRYLIADHGTEPTSQFSAVKLDAIRCRMIADNHSRRYINDLVSIIKLTFKRGVVWGLVPARVWQSVNAVGSLAKGKSLARETEPILPVDPEHVAAIEPHVSRQVWAMVLLQLRTGMRPSEVLNLKPREVNQSGVIWEYQPESHKTEHHGKGRTIMLPRSAQQVLDSFLDRDPDEYCFKPAESNLMLRGNRRVGPRYRRDSYRNAIRRACAKAGVPAWSPNRLRHNFGTDVRRSHGLDAARVLLGHSAKSTTEVYAERDLDEARRVAASL